MRAAAGSLFIALAVFLNSIELSSQVTLEDLFPRSGGIHLPPAIASQDPEFLDYAHEIRTFDYKNEPIPIERYRYLVKREHVIFGMLGNYDLIQPVTSPSGECNSVYVRGHGWMQLEIYEMFRLGIDQRLGYVQYFDRTAGDEALSLRIDQEDYVRQLAEIEAREDASLHSTRQMYAQTNRIGHENDAANVELMQHAYKQEYGRAYRLAYGRIMKRVKPFFDRQRKFGNISL